MRTIIATLCLVAALGAAGSARRPKAAPSTPLPAPSIEREEEAPAPPPKTEAPAFALPLFEVGGAEEEETPAAPVATTATTTDEPTQQAPKEEAQKPAEPPAEPPPSPEQLARYQEFFSKMLRFEIYEIKECYKEARRRFPRLHRDFVLTLTVNRDAEGDRVLESSSTSSNFYIPPAFDRCVQKAVEDILLPPITSRTTVTFPVNLNNYGILDEDDDD